MPDFLDIDTWRKIHLAIGEWIDAWRLIPRLMAAGYAYITWRVLLWYMTLEPKMLEGCDVAKLGEHCIVQAPTTQHAVILTTVIGAATAVFGLYANTGKDWSKGFIFWNKKNKEQIPAERKVEKVSE